MRIKKGFKIRKIAGESVIVAMGDLNVNLTKIITLNATSEWLYNELQNREFTVDTVADLLTEEYEVEREVALTDGAKWIESVTNAGLIEE